MISVSEETIYTKTISSDRFILKITNDGWGNFSYKLYFKDNNLDWQVVNLKYDELCELSDILDEQLK